MLHKDMQINKPHLSSGTGIAWKPFWPNISS